MANILGTTLSEILKETKLAANSFADAGDNFLFRLEKNYYLLGDSLSNESSLSESVTFRLPRDSRNTSDLRAKSLTALVNFSSLNEIVTPQAFQLSLSLNGSSRLFNEKPSTSSILAGPTDSFGVPTPTVTVTPSYINNIDALLIGGKWASTSVSFSFTDNFTNDYEQPYPLSSFGTGFQTLNATQQLIARAWLGSVGASSYYNVSLLSPFELTGASDRDATIRIALTSKTNLGTAQVADFPAGGYTVFPATQTEDGDVWFNSSDYNNPIIGTYAYHTFGHELGHALGLKHGHDSGYGVRGGSTPALSYDRDSMEFSIMTYRSYVGDPLVGGYSNEEGGYAQSLMMYDIAAIQYLYGAWFGYNSGDTNYTFSTTTGEMFVNGVGQGTPFANRIFRTIWDGNGIDTYDFSNYTTNLSIDLTPGGWSDLHVGGNNQRANLGDGFYARGHVFNALQYNADVRSLIENANGGSGNDIIVGNSANNVLNGNGGNDNVDGGDGNDRINLGNGNDYVNITSLGNDTFYGGNGNDYIFGYTGNEIYYGEAGNDTLLGYSGKDTIVGGAGADSLDGGASIDTLSYAGSIAAVTVNLTTNTASGGDATGDIIVANTFENLTGSSYSDILIGRSGNDTINGGAGHDTLDGGDGNDRINLGDGNDYVDIISLGNDTFYGGNGNDYIFGYTGNETYYGEAGNDTLLGYSGNDSIIGGAGKDSLTGGEGTDKFTYTALNQSLLASYDAIADYATGEQIDAPSSVIAATITTSVGNAASLTAAAISAVLTSGLFTANSAKAFTVNGLSGTFIALNDVVAGFNSVTDSIISLQDYTLGSVSII